MQQQPRKQRGDAYLPDKCSNKHQRTASAMCWLWYWSLSTPNSLCVNYKHKTCTLSGETGFQAHCCLESCSVNTASSAPSAIVTHTVFVIKTSKCCVALTHLTQFVPPLSCDGIPVPWHNPGCTCTRAALHVFICACDADSSAERPTSSAEVCWHAPTWQRGLFLFTVRENRFLQASDNLTRTKA